MLSYMFCKKTKLIWVSFSSGNSTLFKLPTRSMVLPSAFYDSEIYRPGALRFVSVLSCICTVMIVSCLIGICHKSQAMQLQNIVVSLHGSEPCHLFILCFAQDTVRLAS